MTDHIRTETDDPFGFDRLEIREFAANHRRLRQMMAERRCMSPGHRLREKSYKYLCWSTPESMAHDRAVVTFECGYHPQDDDLILPIWKRPVLVLPGSAVCKMNAEYGQAFEDVLLAYDCEDEFDHLIVYQRRYSTEMMDAQWYALKTYLQSMLAIDCALQRIAIQLDAQDWPF